MTSTSDGARSGTEAESRGNQDTGKQPAGTAVGSDDTNAGTDTANQEPTGRTTQNGTDNRPAAYTAKRRAAKEQENKHATTQPENDREDGRTQAQAAPNEAARWATAPGAGADTELGETEAETTRVDMIRTSTLVLL
jgi:hypothetical protein